MLFILFIVLVIMIRVREMVLARVNEKWLKEQGAIEYGKGHYPFIVGLHVLFIALLITEYYFTPVPKFRPVLLILFLFLILLKMWVISFLGKYWNTKIYHIPGRQIVKTGPYKYISHPNYIIVVAEIAVIPMVFNLYYTAVIFSVLNAIMLTIRIREENKALGLS